MDCIIGNIGGADLKTIVEFANEHKINFFSAVSPADADQKNNPYFTLLQPRLNTHVERLHKKIQLSHASTNTVFAHRDISSENNAYQYYTKDPFTPSGKPVTEMVVPETGIDEIALKAALNKTADNILVLGILDARVAYNNLKIITTIAAEGYKIKVYGMPTWESIKALKDANEFPGLEIVYTSPILIDKVNAASKYIQSAYKQKMGSPVTDIVYKAFESVYFASHMLNRYGTPFNQSLTEAVPTFVTPYKIQEVKEDYKLKYFENKFLYLVKYKDGVMSYE